MNAENERKLDFAEKSRYKYVCCDAEGNIEGYGMSRTTLENNMDRTGDHYDVLTLLQYRRKFGTTRVQITLPSGDRFTFDNPAQASRMLKITADRVRDMLKGKPLTAWWEQYRGGVAPTGERLQYLRTIVGSTAKYVN